MSGIQLLASSRPFVLSNEIQKYNEGHVFELGMECSVIETEEYWREIVKPILTMPYIYEAGLETITSLFI